MFLDAVADALLERGCGAEELYALCARIAGEPAGDDTWLDAGKALSPANAARCIFDVKRTVAFLRGARDAIAAAGDGAEVVFAGTGPFAPLALPLLRRAAAKFTLIDIHEASVASVRRLVEHFGFDARVICADATTYVHPAPIDVAVVEVMQRALREEPEVEITRNLARQLTARGVVVPQRIAIEFEVGGVSAGEVVVLERGALRIHEAIAPASGRGVLKTVIHTFGGHVLREGDSGLTAPDILGDFVAGERVAFTYATGPLPRIIATRARPSPSSCPPTPLSSPRDCEADRPGGTSA